MVQDASTPAEAVMTTNGDMVIYNSGRARLAKSTNDKVLQLKSGLPSWQSVATADSILSAQGQIIYGDGSGNGAALNAGTSGYFLKTQGASANPVWAEVSGGATTAKKSAENSSNFSTTSTSLVDLTDVTVSIADNSGKFFSSLMASAYMSSTVYNGIIVLDDDGTDSKGMYFDRARYTSSSISYVGDNDGQTLKAQAKTDGGTFYIAGGADNAYAFLEVLEVS